MTEEQLRFTLSKNLSNKINKYKEGGYFIYFLTG